MATWQPVAGSVTGREQHPGGTVRHQPRTVAPVDGTETVLVLLGATKEVERARAVGCGEPNGLVGEHAAHAVTVPSGIPPPLVGGERVLPAEALEHPGAGALAPRHGRGRAT